MVITVCLRHRILPFCCGAERGDATSDSWRCALADGRCSSLRRIVSDACEAVSDEAIPIVLGGVGLAPVLVVLIVTAWRRFRAQMSATDRCSDALMLTRSHERPSELAG